MDVVVLIVRLVSVLQLGPRVVLDKWGYIISPRFDDVIRSAEAWMQSKGYGLFPPAIDHFIWVGCIAVLVSIVGFVTFVFSRVVRFFSDDVVRGARRMKA